MNVKEFLDILDLQNINVFKINNKQYSLSYIHQNYNLQEIETVNINTIYVSLDKDKIKTSIVSDNIESLIEYFHVEYQLPNSPQYISIELNIILKERR
jgi:ABC-type methionine transport system ATPase subunit